MITGAITSSIIVLGYITVHGFPDCNLMNFHHFVELANS